ncbi:MAG TPA: LysE family translocator [Lutibacter sp.]|nr:LysE family translocator [Lutibacter sp.]
MTDFSLIASVTLIHLLAVISPGPDFFMAIKNSLTYSRKTGIYTAIGFGLGIGVHIFYSLAGLALLIFKSIVIFNIIKYLGVAYLLYIGIKSLLDKGANIEVKNQTHLQDISHFKAISQGFLTNVLNPKATLFFLSLFTLVISPDTSKTTLYLISGIMILNTMLWFSLVATFLTQEKIRVVYSRYQKWFNKLFGGVLIALGLKIAFD